MARRACLCVSLASGPRNHSCRARHGLGERCERSMPNVMEMLQAAKQTTPRSFMKDELISIGCRGKDIGVASHLTQKVTKASRS